MNLQLAEASTVIKRKGKYLQQYRMTRKLLMKRRQMQHVCSVMICIRTQNQKKGGLSVLCAMDGHMNNVQEWTLMMLDLTLVIIVNDKLM